MNGKKINPRIRFPGTLLLSGIQICYSRVQPREESCVEFDTSSAWGPPCEYGCGEAGPGGRWSSVQGSISPALKELVIESGQLTGPGSGEASGSQEDGFASQEVEGESVEGPAGAAKWWPGSAGRLSRGRSLWLSARHAGPSPVLGTFLGDPYSPAGLPAPRNPPHPASAFTGI